MLTRRVSIAITIGLYAITAKEIVSRRRELHALSNPGQDSADLELGPGPSKSFFKNPFSQQAEPIRKVTEIQVTTEHLYRTASNKSVGTDATSERDHAPSVSGSSGITTHAKAVALEHDQDNDLEAPPKAARGAHGYPRADSISDDEAPAPLHTFSTTVTGGRPSFSKASGHRGSMSHLPYQFPPRNPSVDFPPRPANAQSHYNSSRKQRKETYSRNNAAWSYAKVALLFFIALFIVWVPSTVNRIYSLARPGAPNYGLSVAAAAVLPTQGFWNALVYAVTSWTQCKAAWAEMHSSEWWSTWMCFVCLRRVRTRSLNGDRQLSNNGPLLSRPPTGTTPSFPRLWKEMSLQDALDMDPRNDDIENQHQRHLQHQRQRSQLALEMQKPPTPPPKTDLPQAK